MVSYNKWRGRSQSPPAPVSPSVRTMVEHFSEENRGSSQGTRTVTRTITPSGEMSVYASQSSVRFKMTSKSSTTSRSRQEVGEAGTVSLPRPSYSRAEGDGEGEGEDSRDLYPITVSRVNKPPAPHRSTSLRDRPGASRQSLASPDFNILHRDTGRDLRTESQSAPQQGYSVVVAIDFGEFNLL